MTVLLEVEHVSRTFALSHSRARTWLEWARRRSGKAPAEVRPPRLLHAVDDVSLHVMAGESVGLVGESGCGKSTFMRLVARLIDPTAGSIRFQGRDIGAIPAASFARSPERRLIQQVFQDASDSLNPHFTAAQAIAEPLRRLTDLRGPGVHGRITGLASLVSLPHELLTLYPHQLSGRQRRGWALRAP